MWYCVVLTGGATDGKHNKRTVARERSTRGRLQSAVARDEAADGVHDSASQRFAEKHDGRAKDNLREVRCSKLKTIKCCFQRSETAQSKELTEPSIAGDRQRLCDGGVKLERVCKPCRRSDVHLRIQARNANRNRNVN